jgi:predicted RNA-binding protein with PIN domain
MLYLFDGYNLLHASPFDERRELIDRLAGFLALEGVRGVVVFDGVGDDSSVGALEVRYAHPADQLLERLAADNRGRERICLVSSDRGIRATAGQEVGKRSSKEFAAELVAERAGRLTQSGEPSRIEDALDEATRSRLEAWRRRRP